MKVLFGKIIQKNRFYVNLKKKSVKFSKFCSRKLAMGFSILDPRLQFQYVYIPFENPYLAKKKHPQHPHKRPNFKILPKISKSKIQQISFRQIIDGT